MGARVVVKVYALGEPALEAGIVLQEVVHLVLIACHDDAEMIAIVLHKGQQRIQDGTATAGGVGGQLIGLINEQHSIHGVPHRLIEVPLMLLVEHLRHQFRSGELHQVPPLQHPQVAQDLPHVPCHGGLACAGVAGEQVVSRLLLIACQHPAAKPLYSRLHAIETGQAVEPVQRFRLHLRHRFQVAGQGFRNVAWFQEGVGDPRLIGHRLGFRILFPVPQHFIQQVHRFSSVVPLRARQVHPVLTEVGQCCLEFVRENGVVLPCVEGHDLFHLRRSVVADVQVAEPSGQTGVGLLKQLHLPGVACRH